MFVWTLELKTKILDLYLAGKTIAEICNLEGFPDDVELWRELRSDVEFYSQWKGLNSYRAHALAENTISVAESEPDPLRAALKIRTKQWIAGKLDPDTWGERLDVKVSHTHQLQIALKDATNRLRLAGTDRAQVIEHNPTVPISTTIDRESIGASAPLENKGSYKE